jgi:hypothetical protein
MFQSSPVTKDGRYELHVVVSSHCRVLLAMFQSSPVTKDGRYDAMIQLVMNDALTLYVSILARH